jgi:hypothetical protein
MVSRPTRVAVIGGDGRFDGSDLVNSRVRVFKSTRFGGNGGLKRLVASLKAGGVDRVIILARWIGHSAAGRVLAVCRKLGVPFDIRS